MGALVFEGFATVWNAAVYDALGRRLAEGSTLRPLMIKAPASGVLLVVLNDGSQRIVQRFAPVR